MKRLIRNAAEFTGIVAGAGLIGLPLVVYAGLPVAMAPLLGLVLLALAIG